MLVIEFLWGGGTTIIGDRISIASLSTSFGVSPRQAIWKNFVLNLEISGCIAYEAGHVRVAHNSCR